MAQKDQTTFNVEVPRRGENDRKSSRGLNLARSWFNTVHLHFATDWEGPDGVVVRVATIAHNQAGTPSAIRVQKVTVKRDNPQALALEPRESFVNLTRDGGSPESNEAPVTARVDMWNEV